VCITLKTALDGNLIEIIRLWQHPKEINSQ